MRYRWSFALVALSAVLSAVVGTSCLPSTDEQHETAYRYDFSSPAQLKDWSVAEDGAANDDPVGTAHIAKGQLVVEGGSPAVVRFREPMVVKRLRAVATCLAGDPYAHINLYLGTDWNGSWEGSGGLAFIMRQDYLLFCANGRSEENVHPLACEAGKRYVQEIDIGSNGSVRWQINGQTVLERTIDPTISRRMGSVLVGAYGSRTAFDEIEIFAARPAKKD